MNADSIKARLKNFAVKNANDQRAMIFSRMGKTEIWNRLAEP